MAAALAIALAWRDAWAPAVGAAAGDWRQLHSPLNDNYISPSVVVVVVA
jgi:hypothetical protein